MNAIKVSPRKSSQTALPPIEEAPLKFLSPMQRERSRRITKDWKLFAYPLFGEMMDKI
ncbi:MAG: hypothetical protein R2786_08240 [Flavobacteriaceae bacterium]